MKVSKPKADQLLFEDESLKDFKIECFNKTIPLDDPMNEHYEGLIIAYRFPGMTTSKQMMMGNAISILTLIASLIENGIFYGAIDEDMVDRLPKLIKEIRKKGK